MDLQSMTVETDLFEHREVQPHFINPCCFGEDFARWLRRELADMAALGFELSEPIQEDYGWGFWASRQSDRFWIALSYCGDGPSDEPAEWVVSVGYDPGLNLADAAVSQTGRDNPRAVAYARVADTRLHAWNPSARGWKHRLIRELPGGASGEHNGGDEQARVARQGAISPDAATPRRTHP